MATPRLAPGAVHESHAAPYAWLADQLWEYLCAVKLPLDVKMAALKATENRLVLERGRMKTARSSEVQINSQEGV